MHCDVANWLNVRYLLDESPIYRFLAITVCYLNSHLSDHQQPMNTYIAHSFKTLPGRVMAMDISGANAIPKPYPQ
jgi:hypothetical protein